MFTSKLSSVTIHNVYACGALPITDGEGWMYIDRKFKVRPSDPVRQCCPTLEIAENFVDHLFPEELRESVSQVLGLSSFKGKKYVSLVDMIRENDPVAEKAILNIEKKILKLCNKLILAGCITVFVDYRQTMCILGKAHKPGCWEGLQVVFIEAAFYGSVEKVTF